MMKGKKCYRFVNEDLTSRADEKCKWEIGKWKKHNGVLKLCSKGFHASKTPLQSILNVSGERWFLAEYRGEIISDDDKFVASEMRLVKELPLEKILIEFSVACAERCLPNFEKGFPNDKRPRKAIEAAKEYLKNSCKKTMSAVESAAWSAAWSAADSAKYAAISAAWSAELAESALSAAVSAVWSAAELAKSGQLAAISAAWSAELAESARSAAESAEIKWQERKLKSIVDKYLKGE